MVFIPFRNTTNRGALAATALCGVLFLCTQNWSRRNQTRKDVGRDRLENPGLKSTGNDFVLKYFLQPDSWGYTTLP